MPRKSGIQVITEQIQYRSAKREKAAKFVSQNIAETGKPQIVKAMIKAGYSKSTANKNPLKLNESFSDLLEKYLPDKLLLKTHKNLINDKTSWRARDAGLDKAYKLKNKYKNELVIRRGLDELTNDQLEAIARGEEIDEDFNPN